MAIIYEPQLVFNVREALGGAIVGAAARAAGDFLVGRNQKPWSYYLGVGFGNAALATGITGAAMTLYAIGDTLDFYLFKSPDGADVRWFLNGVAQANLATYGAAAVWEAVQQIVLEPGRVNELTFVNYSASTVPGATGIPWLAIGDITVGGTNAYAYSTRSGSMVYDVISYSLRDSEESTQNASFPVYVPTGQSVATLQAYSNIAAKRLDLVSGSQIIRAQVTLNLTLPAYSAAPGANELKNAALVGILNERGGLISFDTAGPRNESIWIPGMRTSIMPGDAFSLVQADVASLIAMFTGNVSANSVDVRPVSPQNYQYTAALKGKKSLRRG